MVDDDVEAIHTDEWGPYKGIADENMRHETVNHRQEEWVRGEVHTNTVESVWSLFKRSVVGSYHQLSEKHMPAYLDEMEFRFNNRENPYIFRETLRVLVTANPILRSRLAVGANRSPMSSSLSRIDTAKPPCRGWPQPLNVQPPALSPMTQEPSGHRPDGIFVPHTPRFTA